MFSQYDTPIPFKRMRILFKKLLRPTHIFISYRREPHTLEATFLFDRLKLIFFPWNIFFDRKTILGGDIFPHKILMAIRGSHIFLVLLSKEMLREPTSPDEPSEFDWVMAELHCAIANEKEWGIKIIPILVDNTKMDDLVGLPDDIRAAVKKRSAKRLGSDDYHSDAKEIIQSIKKERHTVPKRLFTTAIFLSILILSLFFVPLNFFTETTTTSVAAGVEMTTPFTASCPSGSYLLNGGYHLSATNIEDIGLAPSANYPVDVHTWAVSFNNTFSHSVTLSITILCAKDVLFSLNTQVIPGTTSTTNTGQMSAKCPTAYRVVGGGYNMTNDSNGRVITSTPVEAPFQGWQIIAIGLNDTSEPIPYAICVKNVFSTNVAQGKQITPQSQTSIPLTCPVNQILTGGGFSLDNSLGTSDIYLQESQLDNNGHTWRYTFENIAQTLHPANLKPLCISVNPFFWANNFL